MAGTNCGSNLPIDGGTFRDSDFLNPTIYGGKAIDLELRSPTITGGIVVDGLTAATLVEQLCEHIRTCVAGMYARCDGTLHQAGNQIPTCDEMNAAIDLAICEALKDFDGGGSGGGNGQSDRIIAYEWSSDGTKLIIRVRYEDNTTKDWPVDFSAFAPSVPDGTAPTDSENDAIPTTIYGGRTALMGEPTKWKVWADGTKTPAY